MRAGVVAKEDELCRGVDYLKSDMRNFSLEAIRGYYLHKEIERLIKDLEDLQALRQSGTSFAKFVVTVPSPIRCVHGSVARIMALETYQGSDIINLLQVDAECCFLFRNRW